MLVASNHASAALVEIQCEKEKETTRQESGHWQGHDVAAPAGGDIQMFREAAG